MTAPLTCPLCGLADGVGPEFCVCPYEDLQAALREARSAISDSTSERNAVLELAAQICEQSQSGHGNRPGGSDGPDAARRNCAILIRARKTQEALI